MNAKANHHAVSDAMRAARAVITSLQDAASKRSVDALTATGKGDRTAAAAAYREAKAIADEVNLCMDEFHHAYSNARTIQNSVRSILDSTAEYALHRA